MPAEPALTKHKASVLLVDDQPMIGEVVRRMLAGEDDIVFHYCKDATQAVARATEIKPTVILQDLVMPDIDGLTLVKHFRENDATRETPMIVLSTKEEPKIKAEAFGLGANDYLVKLPDRLELLARVRRIQVHIVRVRRRALSIPGQSARVATRPGAYGSQGDWKRHATERLEGV